LISLLCLVLFFIFQFISGKNIQLAAISPSFLSISFSLLIVLFLVLFKTNQDYYFSFFGPEIKSLLKTQTVILILLAIIGLIAFYGFRRYKKNAYFFWAYFALLGALMIFIFYQRSNFPTLSQPVKVANLEAKKIDKRVTIIGLEGLDFDFLIPLINDGKLPNLTWFVEKGTWGKLETLSPSEPLALNNSFNTGKLPSKHRQVSLYKYRLLNPNAEIEIFPHYTFFRQLTRTGLLRITPNQLEFITKDIWEVFAGNKISYLKKDWPYQRGEVKPSEKTEKLFNSFFQELQYETSNIFNKLQQAFFRDYEYEEKVLEEKNKTQPQLVYFLLNGLNIVETYFYKYSFPDLFGDIDQEEINKYSSVIEKYYQFYDQIIGKYLASMKEDELLIIYSPHGIEPLPLWKRVVERILGNPEVAAYHENAPEGVIFFYGKSIVKGKNIEGTRLIDIAPTLLYYLGLLVGKDMDGIVQSSIFVDEFTAENPVPYIFSYDEVAIKKPK
ncbi:MAG: alkaline phosphatase family protein, partial [Candidatus Aminicenantaceae bacterium]